MSKTTVICIVPVKNEAWVLQHFIECAKAWADVVIIGDHNSTDGSAQIAQPYDFVKLVPLQNPAFHEGIRRKILIDEARKIPGRRLIVAIDADEMFSANWAHSPEWERMLNAPPGTRFHFDWVEPYPGLEQGDVYGQVPAFIDDGTEYQYGDLTIHNARIPSTRRDIVHLTEIKLLHYVFLDPERMLSKHRYLKCLEYVEFGKRPWAVCIMYQDSKIKSYDQPVVPIREEWLRGYEWLNQYRRNRQPAEECYWWDGAVLDYFDRYGVDHFSKINIWNVDWNRKASVWGRKGSYRDPRSGYEIAVHAYIEKHREDLRIKQNFQYKSVRLFGKIALRAVGW